MEVASFDAISQDISNFTQFFMNPYTLNPSYAGVEGRTAFFAGYRKQWSSIEGAPVIGIFSFHTPVNNKVSIGMAFANDKRGITQVSSGMATGAYTVSIDNTTAIRFGLSAGYGYNSVDFTNIGNLNDPAIASLMTKNSFLIGNAGVSFHKKSFHVGLALPNIFQPVYLSKDAFNITALKPFQSVIFHASNRYYFNKDQNVFEPYLIYRLNGPLPSQFEAAAVLHLQHMIWFGASYKQQFGISGLFGFKVQNQFAIGFSYSIKNSGDNQIQSPSYEVQLGYLVGSKKKDVNAYSFVNTTKEKVRRKTAAEIAADRKKQKQIMDQRLADNKKKHDAQLANDQAAADAAKKAAAAKAAQNQVAKNNATTNAAQQKQVATNTAPKNETKTPVKTDEKAVTPVLTPVLTQTRRDTARGGPRMKHSQDLLAIQEQTPTAADLQHQEEQEKLKRLETHANNPLEEHKSEVEHPHAERHEFVKKGVHHEELDYGTYVIAGVFKSRGNAESYSKGLTNMKFDADFGFLTAKDLWYVFISQSDNVDDAKAQRDKFRKTKIFRDSWLLTVHK
jgi:type IX secretion system PorP/SprF family membrane protein